MNMMRSKYSRGVFRCILFGALIFVVSLSPAAKEPKAIIIGMDGLEWNILNPLLAEGKLPNFSRVIQNGAVAPLRSFNPLLSPLIWTTIATGKDPDAHGILDFLATDPKTGEAIPVTSQDRRVKALWNIASEKGLSVCFLGWLAGWPAEEVNGVILSDRFGFHAFSRYEGGARNIRRLVYPESERALCLSKLVEYGDITPEYMADFADLTAEKIALDLPDQYVSSSLLSNLRAVLAGEQSYAAVLKAYLERGGFDLVGVYFSGVDVICHLFIKHISPAKPEISASEAAAFKNTIFRYYEFQDRILGEILKSVDLDKTTVIICSDHGFRTGEDRPNSSSFIGAGAAPDWHRIFGTIIFAGAGVRRGAKIKPPNVRDIAPTVLSLLGLPVADDMVGSVINDAFDSDFAASFPRRTISTYESKSPAGKEKRAGSEIDPAIREKLTALGYISSDDSGGRNYNNLGNVYLGRGEIKKAIEAFRQALAIDPTDKRALNNMGIALKEAGRYEQAVETFKAAVKAGTKPSKAYNNIGNAYIRMGRPSEAIVWFDRALAEPEPESEIHFSRANAYRRMGEYERARAEFKIVLETSPNLAPMAWSNMGNLAAETGDRETALTCYRKAIELDPGFNESYLNLGVLLAESGDMPAAIANFRKALQLKPGAKDAKVNLALALMDIGEIDQALELTEDAAANWPNDMNVLCIRANLLLLKGRLDEADEIVRRVLADYPRYSVAISLSRKIEAARKGSVSTGGVTIRDIVVVSRKEAEEIIRKLDAGADFAELAAEYSIAPNAGRGGLVANIRKGALQSALDSAIFQLEPGRYSGVIETDAGYHIILRMK